MGHVHFRIRKYGIFCDPITAAQADGWRDTCKDVKTDELTVDGRTDGMTEVRTPERTERLSEGR